MKKTYVVRVQLKGKLESSFSAKLLLEQLRYAGLVKLTEGSFDIMAPHGHGDGKVWAEQNAERMRSFHLDARAVQKE